MDAPRRGLGYAGFARANRVRRRVDFVGIQEQGSRFSGVHYLLCARRRSATETTANARLGITVSRKVGNAVERNRVKRWVRESYRRLQSMAPAGTDLVLIARPSAKASGLQATRAELTTLLRRLGRP